MENFYKICEIVLKIKHNNCEIFKTIDKEINLCKTNRVEKYDIKIDFRKNLDFKIPEKAIRSAIDDKNRYFFWKDGKDYILKTNEYLIIKDFENKKIILNYKKGSGELYELIRKMIKDLIIKSAQKKGFTYLHAAGINFNGKNVILTGNSNQGKTTTMIRFVKKGAKIIGDDVVMIKKNKLFAFPFKSRIDKNLSNRSKIKRGYFNIDDFIHLNKEYNGVDYLIFLKIWNNKTSKISKLDPLISFLNLKEIYEKEINASMWNYSEGEKDAVKKKKETCLEYANLIKNTKCLEFYAGQNEKEVEKSFFNMFKDEIK